MRTICLGVLAGVACAAAGCTHTPPAASPAQPAVAAAAPAATPVKLAPEPGWWRSRVFYQVFVRSFADSNGDGAGDLRGLTQRLDYLNDGKPGGSDLGVDALWLMPIHPSGTYHGYDVTDYRAVNPDYGTLADFDQLIQQAHRRGVRVIIDFLLNHVAAEHPWFQSARKGPDAKYRDYFIWSKTSFPWVRPWDGEAVWHQNGPDFYYGLFWGGMPDLNFATPAVEAEMVDAMKFWLARGVDGFRVDAARYLFEGKDGKLSEQPETHALVKRIRKALEAEHPDVVLVAEAWTDTYTASDYEGDRDEFHLAFGFDTAQGILISVRDGSADGVRNAVQTGIEAYKDPAFEAPFLTNHDQVRIARELGGDLVKARQAFATLMALRGTPFVYYGEEIGMQGEPGKKDPGKRTPMRWNATPPVHGFTTAKATWFGPAPEVEGIDVASQQALPGSLWSWYQRLLALRHQQAALSVGPATILEPAGGGTGVFALLRTQDKERVLFVANYARKATGPLSLKLPGTAAEALLESGLEGKVRFEGEKLLLDGLGPNGFAFIAVR